MGYVRTNPNPMKNLNNDCVIRAISIVNDSTWDETYLDLLAKGFFMKGMPSSNEVWASYLHDLGYTRKILPDTCPDCYTVKNFIEDYPTGRYILATGSHLVAVINGNYFDTWDSGEEIPIYYWVKEN